MSLEGKQSALDRYRAILLTAIDYLAEKTAGSMIYDRVDPLADYYQRLRQQTERSHKAGKLDKLDKLLREIIEVPRLQADSNLGKRIKEETGFDFDIFEGLQERVDRVLNRNQIKTEKELHDVISLVNLLQQSSSAEKEVEKLNRLRAEFSEGSSHSKSSTKKRVVATYNVAGELTEIYSPDRKRKLILSETDTDPSHPMTQVSVQFEKAGGGLYAVTGTRLDIRAYWKDNHTVAIETRKEYTALIKYKQVQSFKDILNIEYIER